MPQAYIQNTSGKGNAGKYIDRFPKIYAAGIRSLQPEIRVEDCLKDGWIQDDVNNFKNQSTQLLRVKPIKSLITNDMRNAGPFSEGSQLINPPDRTKFQLLVEDLKSTVYKSYWNKDVGKRANVSSCLPPNLDIKNTTFERKTMHSDNLYNIIMPDSPVSEKVLSDCPGQQMVRNYCKSSYNPNNIYGQKTNVDKSGKYVKCCLTDKHIYLGTSLRKPIDTAQRNFQLKTQAELGTCLTPNENINCVPENHVFGKIKTKDNIIQCISNCELNPNRELFKKSLAHLNTLRKCLSKRFDGSFFHNFYLQLKYLDSTSSGWLLKDIVYHSCITKHIHFNQNLIEPLLLMWEAIHDSKIKYKTFVNIINYRQPLPQLPKVWDVPPESDDYRTTYMEMVKPIHCCDKIAMAGTPSGRYFDKDFPVIPDRCCKADISYLPHESDAKACLCPSIFTLFGISHRDMYAQREPEKVKKVFKVVEDLNDDIFNTIWKDATKHHPKGLVCYETFRRALNEYKNKQLYKDKNK